MSNDATTHLLYDQAPEAMTDEYKGMVQPLWVLDQFFGSEGFPRCEARITYFVLFSVRLQSAEKIIAILMQRLVNCIRIPASVVAEQ